MRTWIPQPSNKRICGQIAVAVVAGISLEESIKLIGKKGSTKTKDLVVALRKLGYKCPDRCKPIRWFASPFNPTRTAIAQMRDPSRKSGWHWVVVDGVKIYDGIFGDKDGNVRWPMGGKMTSYLPVEKI